ncbi:hypothetical protein ABPG74_004864 [Tetrahymena malaccensis]
MFSATSLGFGITSFLKSIENNTDELDSIIYQQSNSLNQTMSYVLKQQLIIVQMDKKIQIQRDFIDNLAQNQGLIIGQLQNLQNSINLIAYSNNNTQAQNTSFNINSFISQLNNLNNEIQQQKTSMSQLQPQVSSQIQNSINISLSISLMQQNINNLNSSIFQVNQTIQQEQTSLSQLQSHINSISSYMQQNISNLNSSIVQINQTIQQEQTSISQLQSLVSSQIQNSTNLGQQIIQIDENINNLKSYIFYMNSTIQQEQTFVSQLQSQVSNISSQMQQNINNLNSTILQVNQTIQQEQTSVSQLQSQLSSQVYNSTIFGQSISLMQQNINNLNNSILQINQSIPNTQFYSIKTKDSINYFLPGPQIYLTFPDLIQKLNLEKTSLVKLNLNAMIQIYNNILSLSFAINEKAISDTFLYTHDHFYWGSFLINDNLNSESWYPISFQQKVILQPGQYNISLSFCRAVYTNQHVILLAPEIQTEHFQQFKSSGSATTKQKQVQDMCPKLVMQAQKKIHVPQGTRFTFMMPSA